MKHNENRKPTPETDKMAFKIGNTEVVTVKFARKLERRLIQATQKISPPAPIPPAGTPGSQLPAVTFSNPIQAETLP